MSETMTPKRLAEIAGSLPKAGTVPDEWLANPLTIGEMRQLLLAARPAPPTEPQAGSDTPWTVGNGMAPSEWVIYDKYEHVILAGLEREYAERIVAAVNRVSRDLAIVGRCAICERDIERHTCLTENRADSPSWHTWCYYRQRYETAESRLREVEQERERERLDALNEATRLLDEERRRWYAALGVEDGFAPEVIGKRILGERDEAREIARVRSADRQNHEAGCLCSPICRTIALWPSSGKA